MADTDDVVPGEGLSTFETSDRLRAKAGEAVFEIDTDDLGPDPEYNPDNPPHALIQPAAPMTLGEYQEALADTRELWARLP